MHWINSNFALTQKAKEPEHNISSIIHRSGEHLKCQVILISGKGRHSHKTNKIVMQNIWDNTFKYLRIIGKYNIY